MSALASLVVRPGPLPAGAEAPLLSLTADDGSWVQTRDHVGRDAVVVVFVADPDAPETQDALRRLEAARPRIEARPAFVCAVNSGRPDRLREIRASLGLGYPVLYDLLAMSSRTWHQSGRRPYVRDGWAVVDASGRVVVHRFGLVDPDEVLAVLGDTTGERPVDPAAPASTGQLPSRAGTDVKEVEWPQAEQWISSDWLLLDVRTPDEFGAHRHPASKNIPVDELPNRQHEIGRTGKILCVCQTGSRSVAAVGFLLSAGYTDVYSVKGGISIWTGKS